MVVLLLESYTNTRKEINAVGIKSSWWKFAQISFRKIETKLFETTRYNFLVI